MAEPGTEPDRVQWGGQNRPSGFIGVAVLPTGRGRLSMFCPWALPPLVHSADGEHYPLIILRFTWQQAASVRRLLDGVSSLD